MQIDAHLKLFEKHSERGLGSAHEAAMVKETLSNSLVVCESLSPSRSRLVVPNKRPLGCRRNDIIMSRPHWYGLSVIVACTVHFQNALSTHNQIALLPYRSSPRTTDSPTSVISVSESPTHPLAPLVWALGWHGGRRSSLSCSSSPSPPPPPYTLLLSDFEKRERERRNSP